MFLYDFISTPTTLYKHGLILTINNICLKSSSTTVVFVFKTRCCSDSTQPAVMIFYQTKDKRAFVLEAAFSQLRIIWLNKYGGGAYGVEMDLFQNV